MPDQYSGTIRSSAGSTHAYRWRTLSVDRFPSLQEEIDALRHSGQLAQTPAFTNYMNDLSFSSPRQLPVRPLAASDRHVRSAHDHQPPVRRPPYPRFHATELPFPRPHPRHAPGGDPPDHHPGFRSPRGPGRLPFFHETGSRSGADWRNTAATTSVMLRDGQLFFIPRLPD